MNSSLLHEVEAATAHGDSLLASMARKERRAEEAQQLLAAKTGRLFYKAVARLVGQEPALSGHHHCGRRLVSVFDGSTEYTLGQLTGQDSDRSSALEMGGTRYFVYATLEEALRCPFPEASQLMGSREKPKVPLVALLVAGMGQPEYHGNGKFSFPQLLPVAVLPWAEWQNPNRWQR
eukprot:TRINITY_DN34500_c0_g1_i2.p1 TRINITY_DN34500_c0_g1~~TRINITY_DN34500_c0_g1_i2.p1  ORF type:complete len:177 (+),score=39.91 TRINITY_DN34500_c0_g1_i2:79-609(+)